MRALVFSAMMKLCTRRGDMSKKSRFVNMSAALIFGLALAACAGPERIVTKEVLVPVPTKAEAPDWLASEYRPEALPEFVAPSDPRASSALTPEGEKALRLIIMDLTGRDRAWREWVR